LAFSGLAFAIFYAGLGIPVARLADRGNRRNIIAISLAIWSGMTALCGLAQSLPQLLLARIGVGIGEAGSSPPSHSIIADLYPSEKRAGAMGIYAMGIVLGSGFGTMIGGWLAHLYGWRIAIVAVGIPGILLAIFVRLFVVEPRRGLSETSPVSDEARPSLAAGAIPRRAISSSGSRSPRSSAMRSPHGLRVITSAPSAPRSRRSR